MGPASELARRLAQNAEAVCREYLSNGRREGATWRVGDVDNTPGRSLMVRLTGPDSGKGAAGRWVEYVAPRVMLRICDWVLSHRRLTASTQHNGQRAAGGCVMPRDASELARRLARDAEAVCRHYLSNGRRQGRYWSVGDVRNTPGRSMYVRLSGPDSGPGAAGHWTDAASAEYGDLLDVIRESCGFIDFRDVADEARRFLSLPRAEPRRAPKPVRTPVPAGSPEAAQRLIAISLSIRRTLVETYLCNRGIEVVHDAGALRFHPCCYYRPDDGSPTETRPAMIAAVTDLSGAITGAHRTWLAPGRFRQGAGRHAAAGHGPSPRPCRPLWGGRRRPRCRRRHRDDAVAALCAACHADGRRALGQPPCRPSAPADAASTLRRPRRRCRG
jgi:hypothetical protein